MSKTVSEILFAAADLIEPEGAWSGGGKQPTHSACYCAAIAVDTVCGCIGHPDGEVAREFLSDHLGAPNHTVGIYQWNDAPERTQAEVVAKLREAAEKAREQGL